MTDDAWRRCSACKEPIALRAPYWACNVSTCNRVRTALVFCSVSCWEVHLPEARHREAWAVEKQAPARPDAAAPAPKPARAPAAFSAPKAGARAPRRRLVRPAETPPQDDVPREVLVVASRLKDYVRARSGMNTSDGVLGPLSEILRQVADQAIRNAERDGRKTVLDRDVPKP